MKRFISTVLVVTACVFTLNSQETGWVDVDDQEAYCKEFAVRAAEAEWGKGDTSVFSEYYNSYREWYEICMDTHGQ
mgnify:CR=1 FL=1